LKAFLNDKKIKQKYIKRLEQHYKHDEIIKGKYWEDGKGCAVGCTVHSDSHKCYESELGIPEWLAYLEDRLFEGMTNDKAKEFPLRFIKAIPVGFENWQHVYHQICIYNLTEICQDTDNKIVHKAISDIITLHRNEETDKKKWSAAWSAARSAAESAARSAARSTARSAESAARSAAYYKISEKLIELLEGKD